MLAVLACALLAFCIAASFRSAQKHRAQLICKGIEVEISDSLKNAFLSGKDVKGFLDKEYGRYIGIAMDSLDLCRMEEIVDGRSAVSKCQIYGTQDGMLHVKISQRIPAVRFQKADGGFYADIDGRVFPLQQRFASYVPLVDGHIPLPSDAGRNDDLLTDSQRDWVKGIMELVEYINHDSNWKGNIVQIHVMENGDLMLVPREGKERFIIGRPDELDKKFGKIGLYYTSIAPAKEEGTYRTVNVKFENQIICKK